MIPTRLSAGPLFICRLANSINLLIAYEPRYSFPLLMPPSKNISVGYASTSKNSRTQRYLLVTYDLINTLSVSKPVDTLPSSLLYLISLPLSFISVSFEINPSGHSASVIAVPNLKKWVSLLWIERKYDKCKLEIIIH